MGVFEDGSELYVRAIVACKTRRGLIGVLPLEMGTFSLVQSVKLLPPLVESMEGAWNVKCNVKERDKNFAIEVCENHSFRSILYRIFKAMYL